MTYQFFLSYTRSNYSEFLQKLFDDLSGELRDRLGLSKKEPVGFLDQTEIELGSEWDEAIRAALLQSSVMVSLYSPAYFKSPYCGREWRAFHARRDAWAGNPAGREADGSLARIIKPVIWIPPDTNAQRRAILPPHVDADVQGVQYTFGDPDDKLNCEGVAYLLKRGSRFRGAYLDFIHSLAESIVATSKRYAPLPIPDLPKLEDVPQAFPREAPASMGVSAPAGRQVKHVRFVFVAANPNEFGTARDPTPYWDRGGADWKPFLPKVGRRIGSLVQQIAAEEALDFTSDEMVFSDKLNQAIDAAFDERQLVVLLVDPWSVHWKSTFLNILARFDVQNFRNCTVIVPWNEDDLELQKNRPQIKQTIHDTFHFRSSGNPVYFHEAIRSPEELRTRLYDVLARLQAEMRNNAPVDDARPLANDIPRPVLLGRPQCDGEADMTSQGAPKGRILTFYSYKGGTGRSMALANVAWVLASERNSVLIIDWDLEAPGLHRYFRPFLIDKDITSSDGIIDFMIRYADQAVRPVEAGATLDASWIEPYADPSRYVVSIECEQFPEGGSIDFIPAGRQGTNYSTRVTSFNWQDFYDRLGGGAFLEAFKKKLRSEYDYVLIDSRTGVSDTAGVCTIQLPDSLVVFFTYNNQSIDGAYAVASYAAGVRRTTSALRVFPVPTRVDPFEEVRLKRRQRHAWKTFDEFLTHVPESGRRAYWLGMEIPYAPYLSYEERLAVLTDSADDPKKPLAAMLRLSQQLIYPETISYRSQMPREDVDRWLDEFAMVAGESDSMPRAPARAPSPNGEDLVERAEAAFARVPADQVNDGRSALLRLVRLPEKGESGELRPLSIPTTALSRAQLAALGSFVEFAVVGLTTDPSTGLETVGFLDETLLRTWPRFADWAGADKAFLRWRQTIRASMHRWLENNGHTDFLLQQFLLDQGTDWLSSEGTNLNDAERSYIEKSIAFRSGEVWRRRKQRFMWIGVASAGVLVAGTWLYVLALTQRESTRQLREVAAVDQLVRTQKQVEAARLQFESKLKQVAAAALRSGDEALSAGRFDEAIGAYTQVIASGESDADAHLGRANAYRAKRNLPAALNDYQAVVDRSGTIAPAAVLGLGLTQQALGNTEEARLRLQQVLSLSTDPSMSAQATAALKQLDKAIAPSMARVVVHVSSKEDLVLAEGIARALQQAGYRLQGIQVVTQPTRGDVRYAHDADRGAADKVGAIAQRVLKQQGITLDLQPIYIGSTFKEAPRGFIELWLPPMSRAAQLDTIDRLINRLETGNPNTDFRKTLADPKQAANVARARTWAESTAKTKSLSSPLAIAVLYDTAMVMGVARANSIAVDIELTESQSAVANLSKMQLSWLNNFLEQRTVASKSSPGSSKRIAELQRLVDMEDLELKSVGGSGGPK